MRAMNNGNSVNYSTSSLTEKGLVITLNKAYLDTLDPDVYRLTVEFKNGSADADFYY